MLFMIRFDVHQPADMSMQELVTIWNEEAKAALGAVEARRRSTGSGRSRASGPSSRWPSSSPTAQLDQVLASLPIIQEMGGSVDTEAMAVYEYSEFADDLRQAAEGGCGAAAFARIGWC